jgi:SAM-dependent methyltransferase
VEVRGLGAALDDYFGRLKRRVGLERPREKVATLPNDVLGVNVKWGVHYVPSRKEIFSKAIQSLPIRFEDYTFVDIGAGKGEVLLMATEYKFKRLLGVEYSKTLADIAISRGVECVCMDATEFVLPAGPTVIYLYNPFQGKVMDKVIRNIEQSLQDAQRDLFIVYVNPWERRKFARSRYFKTIAENWDVLNWEFCIYRSIVFSGSK